MCGAPMVGIKTGDAAEISRLVQGDGWAITATLDVLTVGRLRCCIKTPTAWSMTHKQTSGSRLAMRYNERQSLEGDDLSFLRRTQSLVHRVQGVV